MKKMNLDKKLIIWLLLLYAAAVFGLTIITGVPWWVRFNSKLLESENGLELIIDDKKAEIHDTDGNSLWYSEPVLRVQDGFFSDIDRDGDEELVLLIWKRGRYGKHRPFWITRDSIRYSQHIFIYDIIDDPFEVKEKWCASDIGRLVTRMRLVGENENILLLEDRNYNNTLWCWEKWGLKNIDNEVTIAAFGDNIIHERIYEHAFKSEGGNFDFLYEPFIEDIEAADIATIQAETILVDDRAAVSGYPMFGSPIEVGEAIKNAGFDVAVCGNNHALDRGMYGINVTTDFYRQNDITCLGIQGADDEEYRPYEIVSKKGIKFALFSYTYGTNGIDVSKDYPYAVHYLPKISEKRIQDEDAGNEGKRPSESDDNLSGNEQTVSEDDDQLSEDEQRFVDEIQSAREEADFIIVFVHWGEEYNSEVTPEQEAIADLLARGGADLVIGTHPHVVQGTEFVKRPDGKNMFVYYSLGNFRADQNFSEETGEGVEALITIWRTYDGVCIKYAETKDINAGW